MFADILHTLLAWVSANPGWAGAAVFAVACLESLLVVGYLVPGIIILFGVGALIGGGYLMFWPVAIWAAAGAIVGDVASYLIGYIWRDQLQQGWPFRRHPALYEKGVKFFDDHGGKSIIFGRFVGAVRPLIPAIAGMTGMTPLRFAIVDVVASILWSPAYLFPGMVFGASLELAAAVAGRLMLLVGLLAICLWLLWIAIKRVARQVREPLRRVPPGILIAFAAGSLAAVLALAVLWTPLGDLFPHSTPPPRHVAAQAWRQGGWRRIAGKSEPVNIQLAGNTDQFAAALRARGWRSPPALTLAGVLHWLAPDPAIADLPLPPRLRGRHREQLLLIRPAGPESEWVLRLWASGWQTTAGAPISIGQVRLYRRAARVPLLTLPRPADSAGAALEQIRTLLAAPMKTSLVRREQAPTLLISFAAPIPPAAEASAGAQAD